MLKVIPWTRSLKEILDTPQTAEQKIMAETVYKPLIRWRQWPDIALKSLTGIFIPPHQRIMLYTSHLSAPSTVYVCSRGTSKSSVIDVLGASYRSLFFPKRKGVVLSASGFRGGQLLFNDAEKWVCGEWADQESGLEFLKRSVVYDKIVLRHQNYWEIDFTSASSLLTVPTNDEAKLRGIRGHDLYIDEANFTEFELMEKVAASFINVLGDFKTGGDNASENCVYYTTTIDYGWRDFQRTANAAYDGLARDLAALEAIKRGDTAEYEALRRKGLLQTMLVSFDYSDTIIRRYVNTRDGRKMEVVWPDKTRKWKKDVRGVPFTRRSSKGRMPVQGRPVDIISTYPINRNIEDKLLSGETPEPIWLAEQRNVVDTSTGDVYPHYMIEDVSCKGNKYILHASECGEEWNLKYPDTNYTPPIMWSCSDPCVIGVDYAPGSRDFSAFVVIRVGPCAEGEFDPCTNLGKTPWSNVIWAEQHRMTSHADVAAKIREFANRYNLAFHHDVYETDTWKLCRAIGLDMRGGGSGVRDELVHLNKESLGPEEYRIFDPLDPDERVMAFKTDPKAVPMLDAIYPTDQLNDRLVEFTVGQMSQRLLFLPKDIPESDRPFDVKVDVGFNGAKILSHQLQVLQQKPTKNFRNFYVKGDTTQTGNKKDLWAAFIYAAKQLRAHTIRQRMIDDTPPPMGALISRRKGAHRGRFRV